MYHVYGRVVLEVVSRVMDISHDRLETHHIWMIKLSKDFDFSDGCDRKSFSLVIHSHL